MRIGSTRITPTVKPSGSIARYSVERIVQRCWLLMFCVTFLTLFADYPVLGPTTFIFALLINGLLLGASLFGFKLAEDRSPFAAPWHIITTTGLLTLIYWWNPNTNPVWVLFPLSAVISVIFFSSNVARLHSLLLTLAQLVCRIGAHGITQLSTDIAISTFIPILSYLIERARRRESQLVEEIAAHMAETDAFTSISWSLTSLTPTRDDLVAVLERACPPGVSLALLQLQAETNTLVTLAAVGDEAPALWRWSYRLRPESTSMVAVALRERRALSASITGNNVALMMGGALPDTAQPMRSVAALPIMRQGAEPFGVLLAVSDQADAVGQANHLGILPAVANQFAVALENARLFAEAQERADHDAMTGLLHHRAIHQRLSEEVARANRSATPFAVLMIDLDRFRLYNETYGHQVGDRIIIRAANSLRHNLRSADILARYGGDEFLAILPDTDPAEARLVASQLVKAIADEDFRPQENAERMPLTLSVGIALYPNDGSTALDLLASAEKALNEARSNGGNCCEMAQRAETEASNGRAIDLRSFGILESLVTAVDHKDRYTKEHSEEVATYAQLLAEEVGLGPRCCALIFDAGLLHDVGKVGVPDAILRKPGKLTDAEFAAMKQHVVLSEALLRCLLPADTDPDVLDAVRYHHERWDGRGYPYGLAGEDVPLIGRIMIVADATSAMHMDRPYRRGLSPAQIVSELRRGSGTQFDPALVEPFIKVFMRFHNLTEADLVAQQQRSTAA